MPDQRAFSIIQDSISAAHRCIQAQNQQVTDIVEVQVRAKIKKASSRASNCAKRAPASLRRRLDQAIHCLIKDSTIDLEVIEQIFETATRIFEEFPNEEASRAALGLLRDFSPTDFSTLRIAFRRNVEKSIAELTTTLRQDGQGTAASVFAAFETVLNDGKTEKVSNYSRKIMTSYMAELAEIWRLVGLKPSRPQSFLNNAYRGRFHRFGELILTTVSPPRSNPARQQIRPNYDDFSDAKSVDAALGREDYQWRVSDVHVKGALGFKFLGQRVHNGSR